MVLDRARTRIGRQSELDWLRGLMLVLMTVTHLPTWFSTHFGQPFGYVSAAEGFVFLSGYLVGSVYARTALLEGHGAMRAAIWRRTGQVYAVHVALLLGLFFVLVPLALSYDAKAITNLASFYMQQPKIAVIAGLLLVYNPPLLDILPMYVLFLLASPLLLAYGLRAGWRNVLMGSVLVWLLAQAGTGRELYQWAAGITGWAMPYGQTGAFRFLAWQILWVVGLSAGAKRVRTADLPQARKQWPRIVLWTAVILAVVFFAWRHLAGQVPFGADTGFNALFDKWRLGPLRLLNFAALAVILMFARRRLAAWAEGSSIAVLGRASLTVFAAHLVLCLALLATGAGVADPDHLGLLDSALLLGTLLTLYAVARIAVDKRMAVRKTTAPESAGVPRLALSERAAR